MLSFVCLPVFIILVYVSGSSINEIESSSAVRTLQGSEKSVLREVTTTTSITSHTGLGITERLPATEILSNTRTINTSYSRTATTALTQIATTTTTTTAVSTTRLIGDKLLTTIKPEDRTTLATGGIGYLNVTIQSGTHAYLPCNVKQLVKKPVSWIRVRDGHILTVDQTTFIADQRFQSIFTQNPEQWSLQIKYVQKRDAGSYECQVSTEPKMSARVILHVVEPKTELLGEANRHVKAGSRVILRCIVSGALEPPLFINWYFDKKQIFLHNQKSWRTEIDREFVGNNSDKQNTIASLIIPSVTKKDSGNYTCSPSNSESITFVLHVLNGEYSASAITSDGNTLKQGLASIIILYLQLFIRM